MCCILVVCLYCFYVYVFCMKIIIYLKILFLQTTMVSICEEGETINLWAWKIMTNIWGKDIVWMLVSFVFFYLYFTTKVFCEKFSLYQNIIDEAQHFRCSHKVLRKMCICGSHLIQGWRQFLLTLTLQQIKHWQINKMSL